MSHMLGITNISANSAIVMVVVFPFPPKKFLSLLNYMSNEAVFFKCNHQKISAESPDQLGEAGTLVGYQTPDNSADIR